MAKVRVELPPDFPLSDSEVRAALQHALHHHHDDDLMKAEGGEPRRLPHRYPQSLIDKAGKVYERQMRRMLQEIEDVLLA